MQSQLYGVPFNLLNKSVGASLFYSVQPTKCKVTFPCLSLSLAKLPVTFRASLFGRSNTAPVKQKKQKRARRSVGVTLAQEDLRGQVSHLGQATRRHLECPLSWLRERRHLHFGSHILLVEPKGGLKRTNDGCEGSFLHDPSKGAESCHGQWGAFGAAPFVASGLEVTLTRARPFQRPCQARILSPNTRFKAQIQQRFETDSVSWQGAKTRTHRQSLFANLSLHVFNCKKNNYLRSGLGPQATRRQPSGPVE